jgi:hypothetical protein
VLPSLRRAVAAPKNGKIAFIDRTETLRVINPDGSGLRRLERCPAAIAIYGIGSYPWSPKGSNWPFFRGGLCITVSDVSLYVVNAYGSGTRRLAHCSPDGIRSR